MKAGDKVVCVDDSLTPFSHDFYWPNGRPVRDRVYVVEAFYPAFHMFADIACPVATISIVGHPIIYIPCNAVVAATASRFRLVSDIGHPPVEVCIEEEEDVYAQK